MISPGTAFGLFGNALLLIVSGVMLARRWPLAQPVRALLAAALFVGAFLPVNGLPVAGYVRGAFGDFSITTLCLLTLAVASYILGRRLVSAAEMDTVTAVVAAGAIVLYPMALGLGYFDPYTLGYDSPYFAGALFAVALASWFARRYVLTVCVVLAVAAYLGNLLDSRNLWDYVMDAPLAVYSLYAQGKLAAQALRRRLGKAKAAALRA